MEDNKYFTPDLESLFIGYELEYRSKSYESADKVEWHLWKKVVVDEDFFARGYSESYFSSDIEIRAKVLSESNILSEGWILDVDKTLDNRVWNHYYYGEWWTLSIARKGSIFDNGESNLQLWHESPNNGYMSGHIYYLPSINEFRKVMQFLRIKNKY